MENATKALEMAGSLLIGVLLLGCLLFAYTRMSELKDTEHKVEVSQQAQDFNQDYEAYNRKNLYGTAMNVDYHAYAASVMFVGCVIKFI